jgi:predicted permease
MMDSLAQETRYAIRKLLRNPGFTAVAVAALALGIGANTAIFSVVNAVLLRPLPFEDPDRLVVIWERNPGQNKERELVAALNFRDWEENSGSFARMAAWAWWGYSMTGTDEAETVAAIRTSPNLFSLLGVEPALGRSFVEEENIPGGPNATVISHSLWQRRFGGADDVVGRTVNLNLEPYTIVGVMPAGFQFPDHERWELWTPAKFTDEELSSRARRQFNVVARLAPGVTLEQARSELGAIAAGIADGFPDTNLGWGVSMVAARELIQASNGHLLILLFAAGFVLLIACANVANLLLARAADRHKEIAIRRALGGSRFSLMRQLLIESLLLAALGGGAAVLIALQTRSQRVAQGGRRQVHGRRRCPPRPQRHGGCGDRARSRVAYWSRPADPQLRARAGRRIGIRAQRRRRRQRVSGGHALSR